MSSDQPTTDDLTARLRDWPTSDGSCHIADERGFCQTCSLRMPCDWAQILDDVNEAADRIDKLEAEKKMWEIREEDQIIGIRNLQARIDELEAQLAGMTTERDDWIAEVRKVQSLVNDIADNQMFDIDREATDDDWDPDE